MIRLKIFFILTFLIASTLSYAQIDYKSLIRNLEDITKDTNVNEYFKELPSVGTDKNSVKFQDERFLRLYGIVVDDVELENYSWSGMRISIKLFDEEEDYKILKEKFTSLYGNPEIDDSNENELYYEWSSDEKKIAMSVELEEGEFLEFESNLSIKFFEE